MSLQRRAECFLFLIALLAFGWFNQGGGWNQNARFAEVRAIVDGHQLAIDNYFCYDRRGTKMLRRYPVVNGDVTIGKKISRLAWVTNDGSLVSVTGAEAPKGMNEGAISEVGCSGDVSFAKGHLHPNKPPGLSFVAVPAYFVISHFERLFHRSPDSWWLMNVNAWLTSVFSVGLISAAGVVIAFRLALMLGGGAFWPAFWTAITFGFGTLFFPFATLLFDHDVTAVLLVAAFYCLFRRDRPHFLFLAGLLAGMAAITNYIAAVAAGLLGLYALWSCARAGRWAGVWRAALWYALGLAGPFVAICAYNMACYGSPFALSNAFQNPAFIETGPSFLGMFGIPNGEVALILLVSPFRGIFYSAPILVMGLYGLWRMRRGFRAETILFAAIGVVFFLVNCSFMGWHAGFSCGSRYLIPATAFLALPCVFGFMEMPRLSALLLVFSVCANFLFAATDAESPVGVGSLAMVNGRDIFRYSPLTDYSAPLFFEGRAWPILNLMIKQELAKEQARLVSAGVGPDGRKTVMDRLAASLHASVAAGNNDPFDLASYTGPVSANPAGVCEGGYYTLFDAGSPQARWNSFNVGEFWFPESRWSVVPLLALVGLLGAGLAWDAVRAGARRRAGLAAFAGGVEEIATE